MSTQDPIINYSSTQRILLLIDLTPLLHLQNPNSYFSSLLSSSKTLLSFPPLSLSLSSFKLFFSSLSPLLSFSTLPNSLSFDLPHQTLISLSKTLHSLAHLRDSSFSGSVSRASFVSSSMAQVIHDYAWDLCASDDSVGGSCFLDFVKSNLVVLFSPVCRSFNDLSVFMGHNDDDVIDNIDAFCDEFRGVFGYVKDAFVSRDIHFSWVDVNYEIEHCNRNDELRRWYRSGLEGLGWGFISSDSIVFGSSLMPFGLIYPTIGVPLICSDYTDESKKIAAPLNLEISDVSGKPLECKYCDLHLLDLKSLGLNRFSGGSHLWENRIVKAETGHQSKGIWERIVNGMVKIDVKGLCRHDEAHKIEEYASDVVLVRELTVDPKKKKEEPSREFFADRVIDLLLSETNMSWKRKLPPLWQILLSFLYRKGYWALVSLKNASGSSYMGALKPFTIHTAFLVIVKNEIDSSGGTEFRLCEENLSQSNSETGDSNGQLDVGVDFVNGRDESRRKHKKHPHRYKDLSWNSFCKAAYENVNMELEEAYLSKGCDASKKLKFLRCWMKQVVKNGTTLAWKPYIPKIHSHDQDATEERSRLLPQEGDLSLPSFVAENVGMGIHREPTASAPEAIEAFFSNLSERIQHGIESELDLLALSQRIVGSCIYWLRQKLGASSNEESHVSVDKPDKSSSFTQMVREVIKILLKDPKELAGKHQDTNQSSEVGDAKPSKDASKDRIREYELQIMFRMEILQSDVAVGIGESIKHKFVKQICSLLESIQCNMEDGFFGDFNLTDYVERTIRSRYSQSLAGVVHKIYEQMDLLLFDDEDESPNLLFNSEESSQSWRMGDNDRGSEPNSTEDSFCGPLSHSKNNGRADDERRLIEAQERRERALRLSSFTRRPMPELQRVWAPKPPKLSCSKSDSFRRAKRKNRRQKENTDMVCETPMSTKRCLFPSEDTVDDQIDRGFGGSLSGSVHKALFQ